MVINNISFALILRRGIASQANRANFAQCYSNRSLSSFVSFANSKLNGPCRKHSEGRPEHGAKIISRSMSLQTSDQALQQPTVAEGRMRRLSKAMEDYLQRKKEREDFLQKQKEDFDFGKKHLANIMGLKEEDMSQEMIDEAIQYLLPSGLFDKEARPFMRPPETVFPRQKEAQFDVKGRPHHFLFYTVTPMYYDILHRISNHMMELDRFQDSLIRKGILEPPPEAKAFVGNSVWLNYDEIRDILLEKIDENQYDYLIRSLDRLAEHPYSGRVADFLQTYRKQLVAVTAEMPIPELMYDEEGRPYMTGEGKQKTAAARAIVRGKGTGQVIVHDLMTGKTHDLLFWEYIRDREQIMWPLIFCDLLWKVDLELWVEVWKRNHHKRCPREAHGAKAKAARYAISMALRPFVDKQTVERMRLAGLLTPDIRYPERKKPGQAAARRKYTWKKR